MKQLTRHEEHVLLTILYLQDNAYLVTIRDYLENNSGKDLSFGTLYVSLKRLEKWKYIKSYTGEATSKRGGKAIKYFEMTKRGIEALQEIQKLQEHMWEKFSQLAVK